MIVYLDDVNRLSKFKINKIVKKIIKQSKKENIKLVLSKKMSNIEELKNKINENKFEILDGRWLFNYLICDVLNYICYNQRKKLNTQNICILANDNNENTIDNIYRIAPCVKNLKIVTNNIKKFSYLEQDLYDNYGIPLQISNNTRKSLTSSDIIINIDFDEKLFNKYSINPKSIVINIKDKININSKRFQGININYYKIEYDKEILNIFENNKQYDENILYESYIYRKDTYKNIQSQIKKDKVKIITLIGNNGIIYENEYLKMS